MHRDLTKSIQTFDTLAMALNVARVGIWDWDIPNSMVEWSENVHQIFGLRDFDGAYETYLSLIHPEDREGVLARIQESINGVCDYYVTHRIILPNGSIHWLEGVGNVVVDDSGRPVRMMGTVRDITEQKKVEKERDEWETKFRHISQASGIVIYDYDIPSGDITWSGRTTDVLGYEPGEMGNVDTWVSLIHENDRADVFKTLDACQDSLTPFDINYRFKRKDNSYCKMHDRGFFVPNADGKACRMLGMMQDISNFDQAEQALHDSETRFEKLIVDIDIGVLLQGPIAEVIHANRAALKLLGLTEDQLRGKSSLDSSWNVIHENGDPFPGPTHPVPRAIATKLAVRNVVMGVFRPKLNDRVWLQVNANPILRDNGDIHYVICTFTDITAQKHTELELKESEQRFRILQQASFGGIAMHNQGLIIDCNQGLCDITGFEHKELVGMNGLLLIAPEYRDMVLDRIKSGYEKPYDAEGLHKDGSRYVLEIQGKNLPYKGLSVRVTEFRDITDRKRAEQNLNEQNARLLALAEDFKRKNEQLEEFTQIVSHNLRSPVGNIITLSGLLLDATTETEREEYLSLLKESGNVTLAMLNDLNDVLKVKQNKNIERNELSLEHSFNQVKNMLSAKITEISATVTHDFTEAPTIKYPGIYLESILLNLLSNALKYRHPERTLVVHFKTYISSGKTILEAKDNGLGINLEKYGHQIFKMRKTFHKHPESRGIGLFMIKNQIESMGGEITVDAKENEGTTFYINFNKYLQHG